MGVCDSSAEMSWVTCKSGSDEGKPGFDEGKSSSDEGKPGFDEGKSSSDEGKSGSHSGSNSFCITRSACRHSLKKLPTM
ncbi:hypothetical protein GGH97_002110 [Coemansia sp. RSA 475]|nr:hypothetical protein GGH97_002110 [Coemansia sp. RSA 475]